MAKGGGAFTCSIYKKQGKEYCNHHRITIQNLAAVVLDGIQAIVRRIQDDKAGFIDELSGASAEQSKRQYIALTKEHSQKQKRLDKLSTLIRKVFEQNIDGILPDEAYRQMLNGYHAEQTDLQGQLDELGTQIAELERDTNSAANFVGLIEKYCDITELDGSIVHELIERIEVHQAVKIDGAKQQEADITFRFIGKI